MKRSVFLACAALVLLAGWMVLRALRPRASPERAPPAAATVLARERAAAHFERGELPRARAELAALLAARDPALEDLERAAAIEFLERASGGRPGPWLERIRAVDPGNPARHYMLARASLAEGAFEQAVEHFRAVLARRPEDLAARVGLAATLADLERSAEARELLEGVVAQGVEHAGGWYVQAVYRLMQLEQRAGSPERAQALADLFAQLTALGYRSASAAELDRGTLVGVRRPRPDGVEGARPGTVPRFVAEPAVLPELAGARELFAHDLDGDGDADFLAAGPQGIACAISGAEGYVLETVLAGPVQHVRAADLGNRDALDLVATRGTELLLLEHASGAGLLMGGDAASRWTPSPLELPRLPAPPADLVLVDFDHEGDLDLLLAGPFGARLLRNDGAAPRADEHGVVRRGAFVDVSSEAALPRDVELAWCATEDFDGDQDVDLLLGGPLGVYLMDGLRAGKFVDVAQRVLGNAPDLAREPLIADFDGDARPDLFAPGSPGTLWRQRADGTFAPEPTLHDTGASQPLALDLDLDGTLDVLWAGADAAAEGALGFGLAVERPARIEGRGEPGRALVHADLERDLDPDLVRLTRAGLELLRCEGPVGNAARLEPLGLKDNRRALGAVVEVRTRGLYRRIYWRGEPELAGCGPHESLDVVRITWPNGAVQTHLDVPPEDQPFLDTDGRLEQTESLIGSCPFLYAWNGRTYGFVTDVLGGTPLGLPIGPGPPGGPPAMVPPDHDEHVLVRGEELVPRDGRLELQLTEELREVTYLDRVRLDVLDHPAECEVYPNERFTFPPFPEAHTHTVRAPLAPLSAVDQEGRDWTSALAREDREYAIPFVLAPGPYQGLATPHMLEFAFDAERVRAAPKLRLLLTGWFYWTDASVNVAAARHPELEFVPPLLAVPDGQGGWRECGPIGFPAGKQKTMVVDVGAFLQRADPRLRLRSTLRLYWDSILLAVDADDAPLRTTELAPTSALLWQRGFSRATPLLGEHQCEWFLWDELAPPRWNQHPGLYTRLGETLPLVAERDDRFVVFGAGDALTLRFDAGLAPPLAAGFERDYIVYLAGWAKDRDPNTLAALYVEPLPFRGMSAYPYGPRERYPDDAEHRAYRAEWNTRPATRWIEPLVPAARAAPRAVPAPP
jgi:tetratricopeptide (TPR) repeat protein